MSVQTRTTALQNEVVRLYNRFEHNGVLTNPGGQPLVEIIDSDGVTIIDTLHAGIENTGIMFADWAVPTDLPLGDYYDRWTFQIGAESSVREMTNIFNVRALDSYINFISSGLSESVSDRMVQMLVDLQNDFIYEAQHIPIHWEQAYRVQQENQEKRVKTFYYFELDNDWYSVGREAVYFHNGQRYTVFEDLTPMQSSSSSSSESVGNTSSSTSSSSSADSSSSSSSSPSSNSSSSSESIGNDSSSSTSGAEPTTTTTTTGWTYKPILTAVGTGAPLDSGTLTKVSGDGPDSINFIAVQSKTSRFSTRYSLAYQNWNREPRPIVRVNQRIVDDGWHPDYNGTIYFDGIMTPEDYVSIDYNFAYFSQSELLSFLRLGLMMMNSTPPSSWTFSNIDQMDPSWNAGVLLYAAQTALKRLIFGLNFQEKLVIFGEPGSDGPTKVQDTLQGLYQDYSSMWVEFATNIKKKLPSISQYVTPEYTLPGGRSRWFRYLYKSGV